jgi:hypothetical protein
MRSPRPFNFGLGIGDWGLRIGGIGGGFKLFVGPDGLGDFMVLPIEIVGEIDVDVSGDEFAGGDQALRQIVVHAGDQRWEMVAGHQVKTWLKVR